MLLTTLGFVWPRCPKWFQLVRIFQDTLLLKSLDECSDVSVIRCKVGLVNLPRRLWVASKCGMLAESCCLFWAASFAKKEALPSGDLHNQIFHRTDTRFFASKWKVLPPSSTLCPVKESYCWPSPRKVDRFEAGIGPRLHFVVHVAWKAFRHSRLNDILFAYIPSHTRWYLAFD